MSTRHAAGHASIAAANRWTAAICRGHSHLGAWLAGVVLVTLVFGLVACSSQTRIETLHKADSADNAPYRKLLVVAVAGEAGQRRTIEDLIVARLGSDRVSAIPSYQPLGASPPLTKASVNDAARRVDADGILIAHVVSTTSTAEVDEGRTDVRMECRGGNPADYFLYDYKEIPEPPSVTMAHQIVMVTNLYDAKTEQRIWAIQSTCFDKTTFDAVLEREARAIVQQLRRDRLI